MQQRTSIKRSLILLTTLLLVVFLFTTGLLLISTVSAATQATYYVSPTGSDSYPGTLSQPFQTITKARDVVRTINGNMTGDIYVYLRGGTYPLTGTIAFDERDSGTNGFRIIYRAYTGETPIISGGTQVVGWTVQSGNIYKATLNRTNKLRCLYINDKRVEMAQKTVPAQGGYGTYSVTAGQAPWAWYSASKSDGVLYNTTDLPLITSNVDDIELKNSTTWNQNIVCVRQIIDYSGKRAALLQQPYGGISQLPGWGAGFSTTGTHTLYNAYEFLTTPGQFYFDKTAKILYYYKNTGEDLSTATVFAPNNVECLIKIAGTSLTSRVRNITFYGLTFVYSDWNLANVAGSYGKATVQGATAYIAFANGNWHTDKYRAVDTLPAAIQVDSSSGIIFERNTIKHTGSDGISLTNDVCNSQIIGNRIIDIAGAGISVGHPQHLYEGDGGTHEKYAIGVEGVCRNDVIKNNYLYDNAVLFCGESPVAAYFVDGLDIEHNQIEKAPYGGICLGWGWCNFDEVAVPSNPTTTCRNNLVKYNRIFRTIQKLTDCGALYTLGSQPNSVFTGNYIKDVGTGSNSRGYHPDEGTAWYTGTDNVFDIAAGFKAIDLGNWGRQHDCHLDQSYSTSSNYVCTATNSTITNFNVYPDANWPAAAQNIINFAGIEPAYQDIIPTPTPTPTVAPTPTPYVPVNGLKLWLKADAGITKDGNNYTSAWADQSGNGLNATQGAAGIQPVFTNNVLNGKPVLRFDGTDDYMTFSPLTVNGLTGMTMVMVASNRANQTGLSGDSYSGLFFDETGSWGRVFLSPFQGSICTRFGSGQSGNNNIYTRQVSIGTNFSTTFSVKNGSTEYLYVNGSLVGTYDGKLSPIANTGSLGWLGRGVNSTYYNGDLAEVLIYNRALASDEVGSVQSYLYQKYFSGATPTPTPTATPTPSPTATPTPTPSATAAPTPTPGGGPPPAGLKLWLKADAGITKDGSNYVSAWADQSGNGLNATQGTTGTQPVFTGSVINGKPVVRFDGSNDYLIFSPLTVNGLTQMTVAIVTSNRAAQSGNVNGDYCSAVFFDETGSWGRVYLGSFQDTVSARFGTGQSNNKNIYTRPASIGTNFSTTFGIKNGTTEYLYVNGILVGTYTGKLATITNTSSTGWLGRGASGSYFNGDLAEVLIYNTTLSSADLQGLQSYLSGKYGL